MDPAICFDMSSRIDNIGDGDHNVVYVTSFSGEWYRRLVENNALDRSILEAFPHSRLVAYHEDDVPDIPGMCMFDLRSLDWVMDEVQNPNSGLNRYFEYANFACPMATKKRGGFKADHALFLKVVAITLAVRQAAEGALVVWVDTDVSFRSPLPRPVTDWLRVRDITYIPFIPHKLLMNAGWPPHSFDLFDLSKPEVVADLQRASWWRVESGIMALTVGPKTHALTARAVRMYRGGMLELARACDEELAQGRGCGEHRVYSNMFLNDIYVWSMLLQADAHRDNAVFSVGLRQGWFAMRGVAPWGPNNAVWGNGDDWVPNFLPASQGSDSEITPFAIGRYLFHHFGYHDRGGLSVQHNATGEINGFGSGSTTADGSTATAIDSAAISAVRAQRPAWRTIARDVNVSDSLVHRLQPRQFAFERSAFIYVESAAMPVGFDLRMCPGQRVEDAVADFLVYLGAQDPAIIEGLVSEDLLLGLCDSTTKLPRPCDGAPASPLLDHIRFRAAGMDGIFPLRAHPDYSVAFHVNCICTYIPCLEHEFNELQATVASIMQNVAEAV